MKVLQMNKEHLIEAAQIPEDGNINLFKLGEWLGENSINMSEVRPGWYIIKDSKMINSLVEIINEDTLHQRYNINDENTVEVYVDVQN